MRPFETILCRNIRIPSTFDKPAYYKFRNEIILKRKKAYLFGKDVSFLSLLNLDKLIFVYHKKNLNTSHRENISCFLLSVIFCFSLHFSSFSL
jgi:hypothetical protein